MAMCSMFNEFCAEAKVFMSDFLGVENIFCFTFADPWDQHICVFHDEQTISIATKFNMILEARCNNEREKKKKNQKFNFPFNKVQINLKKKKTHFSPELKL